jgi:alkanesulfonate monooxygenase SsuD/methylene tetrahydromethanopterin reductase-like flavin-dependent oxidoreductase (luciferase family)
LSNGRLRAGFGLGWSVDEFEAAGSNQKERGVALMNLSPRSKRFGAKIRWSFAASISLCHNRSSAPSRCSSRIRQFTSPLMFPPRSERAATAANGWMPVGILFDGMAAMITQLRQFARDAGRDPNRSK